jgi:hypothetical protein
MNLPPEDGRLFYKLYSALMSFADERLHVLDEPVADAEAYEALPPEPRAKVRNALYGKPELIDQFVRENPANLTAEELDIVSSWRQAVVGKFYVFRHLKKYTVFLSSGGSPNKAYGVLGLVDPLEEVVGPRLPVLTEAVLLPFKGQIIYDGLLSFYGISFGGGVRRMLNEECKRAKDAFGISTSLGNQTAPPSEKPKQPRKKESAKIRRRLEEVMDMIPCPIAGCWSLHGAETAYYYDRNCECHVLEVWPVGFQEPVQRGGNGHPPSEDSICYEFAEFEFSDLIEEVPLDHFLFSQRRQVFEIGWKEGRQDLELRLHLVPEQVDEH